jgi:GNAT superfamily N-acetyltransferase
MFQKGTAMQEVPPSEAEVSAPLEGVTVRTNLKPGDIGYIVYLHGTVYAKENGFDPTFEAYVAGPLSEFVRFATDRERLWIAERDGRIVGCIAIVAASPQVAQLRWFLVDPSARGKGLGKRLLNEAVAFCKDCGYRTIFLWTVSKLGTAAHLYSLAGFQKVEEKPGRMWGVEVIEEKYELGLGWDAAVAESLLARLNESANRGR